MPLLATLTWLQMVDLDMAGLITKHVQSFHRWLRHWKLYQPRMFLSSFNSPFFWSHILWIHVIKQLTKLRVRKQILHWCRSIFGMLNNMSHYHSFRRDDNKPDDMHHVTIIIQSLCWHRHMSRVTFYTADLGPWKYGSLHENCLENQNSVAG